MAFFKLNIYDINDSVERHVRYSNVLKEHYKLVYNSLVGVDSAWNDMNTISFISRVKKDYYKLDDYVTYLDKIYKEVGYFSDSVKSVCGKYGYKNIRVIKYNDSKIADCTRYLNQAVEILNNNLRRLKSVTQDVQYVSLSSVYEKITQIKKAIDMLEDLKADIVDYCSSIKSCLSNARARRGKIEKESLGITLINYGWKVTESDVKTAQTNVSQQVVATGVSINLSKNNTPQAVGVQQVGVNVQKVNADNNENFKLGYNNVAYGVKEDTDINYKYNNNGMDINASAYGGPTSQNIQQTNRNVQLNTPVNYAGASSNLNNIRSGNMESPTLKEYYYSQPVNNNIKSANMESPSLKEYNYSQSVNNNINLNAYNQANVNVNSYGNVGMNEMSFSNNSNNVNLNVSAYNTPTSTSIGNIGDK